MAPLHRCSSALCSVLLMLPHGAAKAMSICQVKTVVSQMLFLPFRGARSSRLATARRAGINTTAASSTSTTDVGTELKEPDSDALAMLVCPFSKVSRGHRSTALLATWYVSSGVDHYTTWSKNVSTPECGQSFEGCIINTPV